MIGKRLRIGCVTAFLTASVCVQALASTTCERIERLDYPRRLLFSSSMIDWLPERAVPAKRVWAFVWEPALPNATGQRRIELIRSDAAGGPELEARLLLPGTGIVTLESSSDLDGDGTDELLVTDWDSWTSRYSIVQLDQAGELTRDPVHGLPSGAEYRGAPDVDGDGDRELMFFVRSQEEDSFLVLGSVGAFGRWQQLGRFAVVDPWYWSRFVDWNEDGRDDLVQQTSYGRDSSFQVRLGASEAPWSTIEEFSFSRAVYTASAIDRRLVVTDAAQPYLRQLRRGADGQARSGWVLYLGGAWIRAIGDYDADGSDDIQLGQDRSYWDDHVTIAWGRAPFAPARDYDHFLQQPLRGVLSLGATGEVVPVSRDGAKLAWAAPQVVFDGARRVALPDWVHALYGWVAMSAADVDSDGVDEAWLSISSSSGDRSEFLTARYDQTLGLQLSPVQPQSDAHPGPVSIVDLDGDGSLDLVGTGNSLVGWSAVGDRVDSWSALVPRRSGELLLGQVDLDGTIDALHIDREEEDRIRVSRLIPGRQQNALREMALIVPDEDERFGSIAATDVDRDGRIDLVGYARQVSTDTVRLWWARNDEGERFDPPRTLTTWSDVEHRYYGSKILVGDLDSDGRDDLLLVSSTGWRNRLLAYRLTDRRTADLLASTEWNPAASNGVQSPQLLDADRDGVLDLVLTGDRWRLTILKGDGLGHFSTSAAVWDLQLVHPLRMARGRALAFVGKEGGLRDQAWLSLFESLSYPKAEDTEPPVVRLRIVPELSEQIHPAFHRWFLAVAATDDCDTAPAIVTRGIGLAELPPATSIEWRLSTNERVDVYRDARRSQGQVFLYGPNEAIARERWRRWAAAGSAEWEPGTAVDINAGQATVRSTPLPSRLPLVQRFTLKGGRLVAADSFVAPEPISILIRVQDRSGRFTEMRREWAELVAEARAEACRSSDLIDLRCD